MLTYLFVVASTIGTAQTIPTEPAIRTRQQCSTGESVDRVDQCPPMPAVHTPTRARPAVPKGNPGTWVSTIDYPSRALMERREGTTAFTLTVGVDGRVTNCDITMTSGSPELDQATCTNVVRRARFNPAMDDDGNTVAGKYSNRVRWQIPASGSELTLGPPNSSFPHGPLMIFHGQTKILDSEYPAEALQKNEQGRATLRLSIDAIGKVVDCAITQSSGSNTLDKKSCELAANWVFEPAVDSEGSAVRSTTSAWANWELPKTPESPYVVASRPVVQRISKNISSRLAFTLHADGTLTDCEQAGQDNPFGNPTEMPCEIRAKSLSLIFERPKFGEPGRRIIVENSIEILSPTKPEANPAK